MQSDWDCDDTSEIQRGRDLCRCRAETPPGLFTALMLLLIGMLAVNNRSVLVRPILVVKDNNNYINNSLSSSSSSLLQFVHIPKNGGTYVENLAAVQDPPLFFGSKRELTLSSPKLERPWKNISSSNSNIESCELEFHNKTGRYSGWHNGCCSWWHIPPRMFTDFDSSNDIMLFAILRDPLERAISEERWRNRNATASLSNETLSSRIRESVRQRLHDHPAVHDCHFLEQHLYVTDTNDEILPNMDILCFERLDSDLRERFPNFEFTNNIDQNESPKSPHGNLVLEPDVIDLLRSVYARDFELHEQFCSF